ncbi:MAG: type II secretion system protein, partial [Lachnospiraceae bacterium]|nr:type II secretion system protein [Lachnospiraceae bacterium]
MKKMNNKGFSLIELIIVIAIMAVLVAIIAPNLTKYLGKSKSQTDKTNLDEIKKQFKNAISDAATDEITNVAGTYTVDKNSVTTTSTSAIRLTPSPTSTSCRGTCCRGGTTTATATAASSGTIGPTPPTTATATPPSADT